METKNIVIVDDERLARVELKNLLSDYPGITIVGEGSNAEEGMKLIESLQPDLVFLDIHMPEQSGFDMLENMEKIPPVIFTTAYDEYAIKAFEFNALDYLLKPINDTRLKEAIDKVFKSKPKTEPNVIAKDSPFKDEIYLKDGDQHHFVNMDDISLFSSFGNYVKVHFNSTSVLVHRSLNQIEKRISAEHFFRANRYAIINVKHIKGIRQGFKSKLFITLSDATEIELSERKSVVFRERWSI